MTFDTENFASAMPPKAPLEVLVQNFDRPHPRGNETVGRGLNRIWIWRLAVFLPALLSTGGLIYAMEGWLSANGITFLEATLLFLIGSTFIWVSLARILPGLVPDILVILVIVVVHSGLSNRQSAFFSKTKVQKKQK